MPNVHSDSTGPLWLWEMSPFNLTIKLELWMERSLKMYLDPLWPHWHKLESWPNTVYGKAPLS